MNDKGESSEAGSQEQSGSAETADFWWGIVACVVFGALFGAFALGPIARSMGWI